MFHNPIGAFRRKADYKNMKERKVWIDNARALAILFVIFGHYNSDRNIFFFLTSYIKIPLFFCVSGYLFKINNGKKMWVRIADKVKTLLIPYFVLSIARAIPMILLKFRTGEVITYVVGLLVDTINGEVLWFLPCLFLTEVYAILLHEYFLRQKPYAGLVTSIVFGLVVMLLVPSGLHIYWHPETAIIMLISFETGIALKYLHDNIKSKENLSLCICCIVYGAILTLRYVLNGFGSIDVNNNVFDNIPLDLIGIIVGPTFIMCLSKKILKSSILGFIGMNTLTFYAFHGTAKIVIYKLLEAFDRDGNCTRLVGDMLIIVACCLICAGLSILINRFFPWMVGKRSYKKVFHA